VDDRENLSQPERLRLPSRWNRLEIFTEKMLRCLPLTKQSESKAVNIKTSSRLEIVMKSSPRGFLAGMGG
jgi:hypothetical protein